MPLKDGNTASTLGVGRATVVCAFPGIETERKADSERLDNKRIIPPVGTSKNEEYSQNNRWVSGNSLF